MFADGLHVQENYYDPYVKDANVVLFHLEKVTELLNQKHAEYPAVVGQYDKRTEQLAELAVDLA